MTARWSGRLAIVSGILCVLTTVVLIAFYILEAPQAVAAGAKTSRLGALNDAMGGVQDLLLVPVAAMLRLARNRLSQLGAIAGVVGLAGVAVAQELYVFGVIDLRVNFPIIAAGSGLFGLWIGIVCLVVGRSLRLSRGLTILGAAVAAGMLMVPVGAFLLGGLAVMTAPKLVLTNYPFLATVAIAIIAIAIGLPIWSIWLGRHLLSAKDKSPDGPPA